MPLSTYAVLTIRVLIALCTRTFFQPDEYFQSLEPAHHLVFGYGHLTWEWMAARPIRSILYPALNVPIYWLLKVTGLSETELLGDWLLIACPNILHGLFAATTDIWLGELARVVLGRDYVSSALLLSLTSFFHALALSRSLSNSLETSLATIAFAYYPWDASSRLSPQVIFNRPRIRKMVLFSALACMVRPPNAVIWIFLYANLLWALRHHKLIVLSVFWDIVAAVAASITFLFTIDSLYYGTPTFTPLNFLRTNLSSVSLFYGSNPWHYYFTQAIPILCTTALPFTLHGIWHATAWKPTRNTALRTMLMTILWTVGIYSLGGHKEWRFIHPILPLLHIFAAKSLVDLTPDPSRPSNKKVPRKRIPSTKSQNESQTRTFVHRFFDLPNIPTRYLAVLLLTLPVSLYIVLFYCSAPISVLSYIRSIPRKELGNSTIGFLMPCHSTPGHAYIHREELAHGGMWALGCEPPLEHQDLSTYMDQTNVFFASPQEYLSTYFPNNVNQAFPTSIFPTSIPGAPPIPAMVTSTAGELHYPWRHEWPRYLVFFGDLLREVGVRDILDEKGYKEVWAGGRDWEGEGKRKGGVKVWKWFS
ncbi:glycosyltransferase family 22 protein [Crassisporium funariophilum]|nr:glycosyltransferase family 22 protein [Crassisporium funariophilum]